MPYLNNLDFYPAFIHVNALRSIHLYSECDCLMTCNLLSMIQMIVVQENKVCKLIKNA